MLLKSWLDLLSLNNLKLIWRATDEIYRVVEELLIIYSKSGHQKQMQIFKCLIKYWPCKQALIKST